MRRGKSGTKLNKEFWGPISDRVGFFSKTE